MAEYKIPFSVRSHHYNEEEIQLVVECMRKSNSLTQGESLLELEDKFARYVGVEHAFGISNATSGLELAAQLCQLVPGDEVVVPGHTFTSSAYPFAKQSANLVWADIDSETRVVSAEQLEKCVTKNTKVIVVPHLYGYAADMPEIMELATSMNVLVVEDVAQAIGVEVDSQMAGSYGDIAVFSFHAHKNITTLGEGGMIVVKSEKYANVLPMLRHNGHCDFQFERNNYWVPAMGNVDFPNIDGTSLWPNNYCIGEAQCALASKLLERVDSINSTKRERALRIIDKLVEYPELRFHRVSNRRHNYHLLAASLADGKRDKFISRMAKQYGIQCAVQYYPLYRYPFYEKIGFSDADCPNTDKYFDNMVSFPFGHSLTDTELNTITTSTISVLDSLRD